MAKGNVFVVGTFDTKGSELRYVADILRNRNLNVVTMDVSTAGPVEDTDIGSRDVAAFHAQGEAAVFATGDRGIAVMEMAEAVGAFFANRPDVAGIIGLGGSGGTTIASAAMRALPVGVPKMIVSTVAAGDVSTYIGTSDITLMYSVTDISGLNRLSRVVLANAANGLAGMISGSRPTVNNDKPTLGLTMFGVTTPGVQMVTGLLNADFECLVFHATGSGGRALETLASAGMLKAVVDLTTTEVADHLVGGICTAGSSRLDVLAKTGIPWIGSCGALDMVNFGPRQTVPSHFEGRRFHIHNRSVTLMRTSPEENARMGEWIAGKLNAATGPVHLLLPEGGVSMLDAPGQPFWDPEADGALFDVLEANFRTADNRTLRRVPWHINDAGFAHEVANIVRGCCHIG